MDESTEDFAALFEASVQTKRFRNGQTIEGTVVAIGAEVVFVNVGGKGEATIEIGEFRDDEGDVEVTVGDRIQAVVVSNEGGLVLSRKLARGAVSARQLEDAFHARLPVEGKVDKAVKGGYEVRIARQRAFCPFSQIDTIRVADPAVHEGRVYTFRIIEYGEGGKKFVVSRRALLEEEQAARAVEVRQSIVVGDELTGRVVSVRDFGAFVDLGAGVTGLLHVSEMAWARVSDTSEIVTPGQEVVVKVLRMDAATQQIALGLKQLTADPWTTVAERYAVGQTGAGRVTRVAEFGVFVELEPGVEGLAHISTFAPNKGAGKTKRSIPVGTTVNFDILSVDPAKKRIGISLAEDSSARAATTAAARAEAEDVRDYTTREDAAQAEGFGSLADKLRGALKPREK